MPNDDMLTPDQIEAAGLADWRTRRDALRTRFRTQRFTVGLDLVNQIGAAAEAADHHPDIDLRYGYVDVGLWSHDVSGISERDVALARRISELAAGMGVEAEPPA